MKLLIESIIPKRNVGELKPLPAGRQYFERGETARTAEMRRIINSSTLPVREIAKQLGITHQRVYQLREPVRIKRLTAAEIAHVVHMNAKGVSYDELAASHGMSRPSLMSQVKRLHADTDWYAHGVQLVLETNESIDSICERLGLKVNRLVKML